MIDTEKIIELQRLELIALGEDPDREGLRDTPSRVAKAYQKTLGGYDINLDNLFTTFDSEGYDELVLLKNIKFYSRCEHHREPFFGVAHVGYIANGKIVGISKLARIVDAFARRLQNQERIGKQVADTIEKYLQPLGVGVVIEGQHFCMMCRGVEQQDTVMVTSVMRGVFRQSNNEARSELMSLINKGR